MKINSNFSLEREIYDLRGGLSMNEKEIFNFQEVLIAVLNGADDVATWFSGNHEIGHKEYDEGQEVWSNDYYEVSYSWELVRAVVIGVMKGKFSLYLTARQEKNLRNIINWLQEDGVIIKLPA